MVVIGDHLLESTAKSVAYPLDMVQELIVGDDVEHGLLTVAAGDNVMRVLPPLVIEDAHVTEFVERLSEAARRYEVPQAA